MKRLMCIGFLFVSLVPFAQSQIYVSPTGDDANPGTFEMPFRTLTMGMSVAGPDSLIYMRGGVYNLSATISTTKSGLSGHPIKVWAYPGEKPTLDFTAQATGLRGIQISHNYWYLKGLEIANSGDNGIYISGGYNTVELCVLHNNEDTGLQISGGGNNNLILNCDSYENYDPTTHGGNADGFAPKLTVGPGNVFRGCRSWNNSDDGWDCYASVYAVIIENCWTFRNGINIWGDPAFTGNGNGFKVGGNYTVAPHVVTNCVAFDNVVKGFDQNHNAGGVTLYNCTAWRNQRNYSFPDTLVSGINVIKNNISFQATSTAVSINSRFSQVEANSWQGFTVTTGDFQSFDTALAIAPRKPDGSLPDISFLHLAPGSSMIDAGVDVGLAYNGSAPDLGAFESGVPTYTLTVTALNGFVTKIPDKALYNESDSVVVTAFPLTGYHFTGWGGDTSGWENPIIIVMDQNKIIDAGFSIDLLTIRSVAGVHGTIDPPDSVVVPYGGSQRFTFHADVGYRVDSILVDDIDASDSTAGYTFMNITSGHMIRVVFGVDVHLMSVSGGWNIISLPWRVDTPQVSHLFPSAITSCYAFDPLSGYTAVDTLVPGKGYWMKFASPEEILIAGAERTHDTIAVEEGWNLVGGLSETIAVGSIEQLPPGILTSTVFDYNGSYMPTDVLVPGRGYWVKAAHSGRLVLGP